MSWTNYHSHTKYCDGSLDPELYIQQAIDLGMIAYGFSGHAPINLNINWCVKDSQFENYMAQIEKLKKAYRSKIEIYNGLEIDYIPGIAGRHKHLNENLKLDYFIGSIHFVEQFNDGTPWGIDHTFELFQRGLQEIFKDDIKSAVIRFYELSREMINHDNPDIIGHLDKIKMFNNGNYFSESDSWYKDQVFETLKTIKKTGSIVEINTRGYYRYNQTELYPSSWILEIIRDQQIPVMINSDCHKPEEISGGLIYAANLLRNIGIKEIWSLIDKKWQSFKFNEEGLIIT